MFDDACEKITAIKHQNGVDFWIISPQYTTNTFYSYLLTSTGVSLSPIQNIFASVADGIGYLKSSSVGNRIAAAYLNNGVPQFNLFDFDRGTGLLSNEMAFPYNAYGFEFSLSSNILYLNVYTVFSGIGEIFQYDLLAGSTANILSSELIISNSGIQNGALQLAPDGKIYFSPFLSSYLHTIDNPNILGAGCNYSDSTIYLAGRLSKLGLPTFFSSIFSEPTPLSIDINNFLDSKNRKLIRIVDVLGREANPKSNMPLFYIYDNGTVEKRIIIE